LRIQELAHDSIIVDEVSGCLSAVANDWSRSRSSFRKRENYDLVFVHGGGCLFVGIFVC
jgi:hypothetical protein